MEREADNETIRRVERITGVSIFDGEVSATINRLNEHVNDVGMAPDEYIVDRLAVSDIVMLGELAPSRQSCELLVDLVPSIAAAGVWCLAVDWLLFDDQVRIDDLVNAQDFDGDEAAHLVLRGGMPASMIPADRVEVLHAAWEVNRHRDVLAPPFRVIGLEYELAYDHVTDRADLRVPQAWPHLRHKGPASRFMSDVLDRFVIRPRQRALVSCATDHALTHHRREIHPVHDVCDAEEEAGRALGAGNHLFGLRADRISTVLVHQPMIGADGASDHCFAAEGLIDLLFARGDAPKYPVGFDVAPGPFAPLRTSRAHSDVPLGSFAHGWIFLDPIHSLESPRQLTDHIGRHNVDDLKRRMLPGPSRRPDNGPAEVAAAIDNHRLSIEMAWNAIGT